MRKIEFQIQLLIKQYLLLVTICRMPLKRSYIVTQLHYRLETY